MKIRCEIPLAEYGTIATLAALAKTPIDKYVVETVKESEKATTTTTTSTSET